MIKAYANSVPAQPHAAEALLLRLQESGMHMDAYAYNNVIRAYAHSTPVRSDDADKVFTQMEAAGVQPDFVTYSARVIVFHRADRTHTSTHARAGTRA
jgi:pentatricopeptide repeat protein